jgi:hypothetical protein
MPSISLPRVHWTSGLVLAFLAATLMGAAPVQAATFAVTRFDDPTPNGCAPRDCSLREAVVAANLAPNSTIRLPAGSYKLTIRGNDAGAANDKVGDLDIRVPMTISGASAQTTAIRAGATRYGGIHRAFDVSSSQTVTISGLTIMNGRDVESTGGGCIRNVGSLVLASVVIKGCTSSVSGGGIASFGALTIRDSKIKGNLVDSPTGRRVNGGGIAGGDGTLIRASFVTISTSVIKNNTASSAGNKNVSAMGGGLANTATMTITDSVVSGNKALNAGGAINGDASSRMTIVRTTFDLNTSRFDGGGIDNDGTMTIAASTFSNNRAGEACVGAECDHSFAGGILNTANGTMFMDNSTLSGNVCKKSGGGILNAAGTVSVSSTTIAGNSCGVGAGLSASDTIKLKNTIIANNTGGGNDCSGAVSSGGYNLVRTGAGCMSGVLTGNITGLDPLLLALADNGGSTWTMTLSPNSPAIDAGDPSGCEDHAGVVLTADQRGLHRPSGRHCDIGAVELQR